MREIGKAGSGESPVYHEVNGDILSTNAETWKAALAERLRQAGEGPLEVFHLNLERTHMVDSVGLNLLVWMVKQVQSRKGRLRITLSDPNVLRTLQFTRLDRAAEVVVTK